MSWVTIRHCRDVAEASRTINQLRRKRTTDKALRRRSVPGGAVRIQELRGIETFNAAAPCIATRTKPYSPNDHP